MKKTLVLIFSIFLCFCFCGKAFALENVSIADNDYELVCKYDDGAELTIAQNGVYLVNTSIEISSSSQSSYKMFLKENQKNKYDSNGAVIEYNHDNILTGGKCPSKLYMYSVPAKYENEDEEDSDIENLYYATDNNITSSFGSHTIGMWWWKKSLDNATLRDDLTTNLVSEEAYLRSSKNATICDYESVKKEAISSSTPVSIYLYNNLTFLEMGTKVTIVNFMATCPSQLTDIEIKNENPNKKYLYVNDPSPQTVADDGISEKFYYNNIRFFASSSKTNCSSNNKNATCQAFQYIGTRQGDPQTVIQEDVCKLLGNRTINLLKDISGWLQILVPALVMVLIGIDITKMVLSGNLEEELPKKKKSIFIRLTIMVGFFFLPFFVGLLIKLLNASGIKIGDLECFFR